MKEAVWYCVNDGLFDLGPAFDTFEEAEALRAQLGAFRVCRYAKEIGYVI